jgi:hypothetical protein
MICEVVLDDMLIFSSSFFIKGGKGIFFTFTDSSNGRWLEQSMTTAGVAVLRPTGNGTGASGNLLHISGLPTSNPGPGILWNDAGTVKVGT